MAVLTNDQLARAILHIDPEFDFDVFGSEVISWRGPGSQPSNSAIAAAWDEIKDIPVPSTPNVPMVISDRQFFQALAMASIITQEEALSAVKTGDIPAAMQVVIDSLSPEEKFAAEMLVSGAVQFRRDHPMVNAIGYALSWTSEQVDNLWITASEL